MRIADIAEDFNYTNEEHCEDCGSMQLGITHHCNDSMGMATPVFWQCTRCLHPPLLVNIVRTTKRVLWRTKLKIAYYMQPRAERLAKEEKRAAFKAKLAASRAARALREAA